MKLNQVTVGCTDYGASVAFYRSLGLRQIVDSPPSYARFETRTGETFSIHHTDEIGSVSTVVYFEVDDVDAEVARIEAAGMVISSPAADQGWRWREARLHDPAGNEICIFHGGEDRRFPPWRLTENDQEDD
ncbi:VOC family protein [Pacificimonas sp. WHA3]|uniref:VOC family protein n=1 Tax=Pacificimonas pallii TaxID=2827236 RepID=A0ABS6SDM0_9SPHN|nr:VOC family protein [Pacificimonas pallii]MBV7256006.1 VOC family protein [Pacificimonas pallii]